VTHNDGREALTKLSARQKEAALRRAIIRVKPEYYSWSTEAQERYRVTMPEEDLFRINRALLQALFGIRVNTEESMKAAIDDFDDARQVLLTETMLLILGIGVDSFYLNEYTGDKTILDFPTLYDYDHDDHCFQEQAWKEEDPEYVVKPYRGRLYYRWARLQIDGAFHYAFLCMAAGHIFSLINELGAARISELIPYSYVDGKDHGKREGSGTVFDQRIDAAGLEGQLQELMDRFNRYVSRRHDSLALEFDQESRKVVYIFDKSRPDDPHMDFIFTSKTALQAVRFRHFMVDCRAIARDGHELDPIIEREKSAVLAFLEETYRNIMENFDLKVVKFRKKNKIIIADGALDALFEAPDD
jgi:hypothetical protein